MAKRKRNLLNPSGYTPAEVRKLHRQGFAVRGYIPGAPDAVQPRLASFLRKQAAKTISTAYGPVESALSDREARITAVRDKRARDHQAFQAWQAQQQAQIRSEAESRRTALMTQVQQQQQELTNDLVQITQQAQTRLGAGGVQGNLDMGGTVSGAQRAAAEKSAANVSALGQSTQISGDLLAATQANNQLAMKALEAKDFARSMEEMAALADDRTKVALQRGADHAKQLAHLFDMEVEKAQQNSQLQLAGQKLGVQMAGIRQRDKASQRTSATARRGQDLTFQAATRRSIIAAGNSAETQRHNREQERIAREKLKATDPGSASKQERKARRDSIRAVNRMASYMNDKLGKPQGKVGSGKTSKGKNIDDFNKVVEDLRASYPKDLDLITIAYDLWRFGRLRPGARKRWRDGVGGPMPKGW